METRACPAYAMGWTALFLHPEGVERARGLRGPDRIPRRAPPASGEAQTGRRPFAVTDADAFALGHAVPVGHTFVVTGAFVGDAFTASDAFANFVRSAATPYECDALHYCLRREWTGCLPAILAVPDINTDSDIDARTPVTPSTRCSAARILVLVSCSGAFACAGSVCDKRREKFMLAWAPWHM